MASALHLGPSNAFTIPSNYISHTKLETSYSKRQSHEIRQPPNIASKTASSFTERRTARPNPPLDRLPHKVRSASSIHKPDYAILPQQWHTLLSTRSANSRSTQSSAPACSTTHRYFYTYTYPHYLSGHPLDILSTASDNTPGSIQYPQPYRLPLRRRRRHPRSRILHRLHILHPGFVGGLRTAFCAEDRRKAGKVLLSAVGRFVVGRCVWRVEWVCVDLDAVLWAGEGVRRPKGIIWMREYIAIKWRREGRVVEWHAAKRRLGESDIHPPA
jgi:hypothetical protein